MALTRGQRAFAGAVAALGAIVAGIHEMQAYERRVCVMLCCFLLFYLFCVPSFSDLQ
jgi:hypothetical protein